MAEKITTTKSPQWHALQIDLIFQELISQANGITQEEAKRRLTEFGPKPFAAREEAQRLDVSFLAQFKNLLIYVLLISGGITAIIGHWVDAGVILGVVLLNALIGFIQEGKAEKALEALRDLLSSQATVLRDGRRVSMASDQLVPGDVAFLQSGDKVRPTSACSRPKSSYRRGFPHRRVRAGGQVSGISD